MYKMFKEGCMIPSTSSLLNKVEKPEDHVYQTQENVYQLLTVDGKSKAQAHWEQPAYQGLTKASTEGDWSEGEVYTNPIMYQELSKTDAAAENDYLPAYHPIMKHLQSKVCIFVVFHKNFPCRSSYISSREDPLLISYSTRELFETYVNL